MSKLAIITGASSGIGAEFAKQLSAQGYSLLLIARREEQLKKVAQHLTTPTDLLALDLTQKEAIDQILNFLDQRNLCPALLINNAGFGILGPTLETDFETYDQMIELNVKALTRLTLSIASLMKSQTPGQILNVASIAAFCPCPKMAVYGATKAFVLAFSENLAMDLRPYGITVSALCPGPTRTSFWQTAGVNQTDSFDLWMSDSTTVVRDALVTLEKQKINQIPGWSNKALSIAIKFVPRNLSCLIAQKIFSWVIEKNK